jgi:pyrroloquinoline quinone (PQQ) biosynthesis protein C
MNTGAFLDSLRDEIAEHNAMMLHPLMLRLYEGDLTKDQVAGWVRQFWVIPHTHLINNAGKLAHAQLWRGGFLQQLLESPYHMEMTERLGQAVLDEMGKTEISPQSHYECYFYLTDALGIPKEEMGRPEDLLPNSLLVMHAWTKSALEFSLLELIASHNFVNDHTNTIAYPKVCKALMEHYGFSRKAVTWFDLHGEVDKEHGAMSRYVLETIIKTEDDQRVARYAAKFGLGIKWALFDGVMNAYVNKSYPI